MFDLVICPASALTSVRGHIAHEALSLRDRVRDAYVPLPAAALGASLLTLVAHLATP